MHIDFATQIFNDKSMKVMLKVSWEQFTTTKNLRRSTSILSDSQSHNFLSNTPFENAQRWMGKNTFPILLFNNDNMLAEH